MEPALAQDLVDSLKDAGIDFMTYLPETRLSQILPLIREDPSVQLVPVASEAEAVTIAVGATLGGKQAACYMESTGLYVSSYSLLVTAKQMGVAILLVVAYLGGFEDRRNSFLYATIGEHAEPYLNGMGIKHKVIEDGANLNTKVREAVRSMNALRSPAALLFSGEFTV